MNMLDILELDCHTFRTCLPVLRVSVHRHLPGLSNFIATVQVLVAWLMCSHMGNWELLLFSLRSCCIAIAVCIAILWLCCAPFTGKHVHCQPPLSSAEQSCISGSRSHMLAWKRLARQWGWSPVVQNGVLLGSFRPLFFQLSFHSYVCKPRQAI